MRAQVTHCGARICRPSLAGQKWVAPNVAQDWAGITLAYLAQSILVRGTERGRMATATTEPVRLPPGPRIPKIVQGIAFLTAQCEVVPVLGRRYGGTFTINLPIFGKTVFISDPLLVKDIFSTSDDLIERPTNVLGPAFGPGSTFSLTGKEHLKRRKLVLPAFHGKGVRSYEHIVEEEVMSETANWPEGREFESLETMGRLTLNSILRAMFGGEEGEALDELPA